MALANVGFFLTCGQHIHYSYEIRSHYAARRFGRMNAALADANAFYLRLYAVIGLTLAGLFPLADLAALLNLSTLCRNEAGAVFGL